MLLKPGLSACGVGATGLSVEQAASSRTATMDAAEMRRSISTPRGEKLLFETEGAWEPFRRAFTDLMGANVGLPAAIVNIGLPAHRAVWALSSSN
jgi:hypothetical protein